MTFVVCFLFCLCPYCPYAYIANNMDPDQTFPKVAVLSGFIAFKFMIKCLKCT